jgi:hypothetical protein
MCCWEVILGHGRAIEQPPRTAFPAALTKVTGTRLGSTVCVVLQAQGCRVTAYGLLRSPHHRKCQWGLLMRRAMLLLIAMGTVAGCGQSISTASRGPASGASQGETTVSSASPVASASPSGPAPDVVTHTQAPQNLLHVVGLTGGVVGSVPLSINSSGRTGVGPHHLWVTDNHSLTFYGASGTKLATDAFSDAGFSSMPVFAADGSHWAWSYSPSQADLQHSGSTTIYLGTQTSQMTAVATHTESVGMRLTPIAWADGKVYLTEYFVIGGGRIIFPPATGAWSLDPSSGMLAHLDASCQLQDVASDGSLLCLQGQLLTVIHPGGGTTTLVFPGSWDQSGAGRFSADGRQVVVSAVSFQSSGSVGATFVGNATGGSMEKVTDAAFGVYFFPDGRFLAQTSAAWVVENQDGTKLALSIPAGDTVANVLAAPKD